MFKIYEKLGGRDATLDVLSKRRGKRPGKDAVQYWEREGKLPAIAIVALWDECRERGIRFSPDDCRAVKQRPPVREQCA